MSADVTGIIQRKQRGNRDFCATSMKRLHHLLSVTVRHFVLLFFPLCRCPSPRSNINMSSLVLPLPFHAMHMLNNHILLSILVPAARSYSFEQTKACESGGKNVSSSCVQHGPDNTVRSKVHFQFLRSNITRNVIAEMRSVK